jgi:drug/metabolite transporter (DMT)-like permease
MLNLALAVACSVAIGVIFKHTGSTEVDRTALLTVNYAAAVGVAALLIWAGGRTSETGLALSAELLALGGGVGVLLIAGFFLLAYATEVAGLSLAVGVMRVSVVIPFVASWWVWQEVPSPAQGGGMVLAGIAFFLLAQKKRAPEPVAAGAGGTGPPASPVAALHGVDWFASGILALTFVVGGSVDLSMKIFEEQFGAANSQVLFLLLAFGAAFLIGAVIVGRRILRGDPWPSGQTIGWGVVLGIANYGSLEFLLRAVAELPGPFVFPANNIAIMVLSAGIGVFAWSEQLTTINKVGMGCAVVALVLLRL